MGFLWTETAWSNGESEISESCRGHTTGKLGRSKVGLGKLGLGKFGFGKVGRRGGKLGRGTTSKSA